MLLYTLFSFAVYKVFGVVLTLAGIAGFILSIGMAVDANVLIFARMKEELRLGRTLSASRSRGASTTRGPSIRDSNISTMISCAILYWFGRYVGASIIQGFALTLFLGVVVSMFTAVTVSRTLLRLMVDTGVAKHPSWYGTSVQGAVREMPHWPRRATKLIRLGPHREMSPGADRLACVVHG